MDKKNTTILLIVVALLAIIGFWWWQNQPGQLDEFAKCLKDKGVKFYGAFWCSHCQNQKKLFGKSQKYLPYVECSTPDSRGQLQVCKDASIQVYPTWHFADNSAKEGELTLQQLSEKSGCQLPQ